VSQKSNILVTFILFILLFCTANPDVTLQMDDQDLMDLMSGSLNAQKAFFQGKLKIKGNMALAMKLREFQTEIQKATSAKL
jgi:putative sterol carrier protein